MLTFPNNENANNFTLNTWLKLSTQTLKIVKYIAVNLDILREYMFEITTLNYRRARPCISILFKC